MTKEEQLRQLEQKIAGYCISSNGDHREWLIGRFQCKVGRRQCHSSRVGKWLGEIKKLEAKGDGNIDIVQN